MKNKSCCATNRNLVKNDNGKFFSEKVSEISKVSNKKLPMKTLSIYQAGNL